MISHSCGSVDSREVIHTCRRLSFLSFMRFVVSLFLPPFSPSHYDRLCESLEC
jgi:hypothetical protein